MSMSLTMFYWFTCSDNPNLKSIIIIRDPTERSKSHHRFSYSQLLSKGVGNINYMIQVALEEGSRLSYLYLLALKAIDEIKSLYGFTITANNNTTRTINRKNPAMAELLDFAMKIWTTQIPGLRDDNTTTQRAATVLLYSIYFPPIYVWDEELGVDHVYVIEGERITLFRSAKKLENDKLIKKQEQIDKGLAYTKFVMTKTLEDEMAGIFG